MNEFDASVHVWTIDDIKALPEFGAGHGWFYGLVQDDYIDSDGHNTILVLIAEIYPGMGYAAIDGADIEHGEITWQDMLSDLVAYKPKEK